MSALHPWRQAVLALSRFPRTTLRRTPFGWPAAVALIVGLAWTSSLSAMFCPFCSAVARTFSEQIDSSDVVVIASLVEPPSAPDETTLPRGKFRAVDALKGSEVMDAGDEFMAIVVGRNHAVGDQFLLMGNGFDEVNWTTPMKASQRVVDYLKALDTLPEQGADRLAFFAEHFEDEESVLAYDAYDEFARAPYEDVKQLRDRLDRDKLIGWIEDPDVMKSRKRLYYTLLGVCGTEKDVDLLAEILRSGDRERQAGLDALIACYLTLQGDKGLPLIEELFLRNPKAEYIDVFSAIQALRFHGTEADKVSTDRIVRALRHVLDRPDMADMVIPDLARWKDWEVMERLVTMFREANTDETNWVRTPIISYLQACPKPAAKQYIDELREIDPAAVKRAEMLADLTWDDEEDEDDMGEEETEEAKAKKADRKKKDSDSDTENAGDTAGGPQTDDARDADMTLADGPSQLANVQSVATAAQGMPFSYRRSECIAEQITEVDAQTSPRYVTAVGATAATNSNKRRYVSTDRELEGNDQNADSGPAAAPMVISSTTVPLASTGNQAAVASLLLLILGGACVGLFVLLWSVLNGWFERLIF